MVAGDLAHALPNDGEGFKKWEHGDLPPLRYKVVSEADKSELLQTSSDNSLSGCNEIMS